ncbi:MAG: SCO family protein [Erythrobacter sp.]|jgi:protein SCO1/2|uniref:SCO family protein n=1 Tax=Erythrobacter sp. TaxID=1042 RepID=UPI002B4653C9|nr:SCO family protein [Erythrobacter sp.]WRH70157.1 MAG: SCO family protein [Erythrobacter sp.]
MQITERATKVVLAGLAVFAISGAAYLNYAANEENSAITEKPAADPSLGAPVKLKLTDADGKPFDLASLNGKPVAVFFGFTQCPDLCPMTMQKLASMRKRIGAPFNELHVLFVSLDPERDTPETLKSYFSAFPLPVTGLTGSAADIAGAAKQFDVFYETVRYSETYYAIDHTASIFLIDRDGKRAGEIGFGADDAEFQAKLEALVE